MAKGRISSIRVHKDTRGFRAGLSSAIFEWLLIFLLFVNALFSYLLTKLAQYCELQTPCLLCSRLDHVLGNEKPGFYWDLICGSHKLEMSSLVFCHKHDKLSDIHGMCEGCLSSFTKEKKPSSETYRLLVGKLGKDHECCVHKDPLKHHRLGYSRERNCSCCNEPWKLGSYYTHRVLLNKYGPDADLNVPLPGCANLFDGLRKRRERTSGLMVSSHLGYRGFDPLSHIGYTELKLTSDSESEVPLSDDDDASAVVREKDDVKEQLVPHHVQPELHASGSDILLKVPSDVSSSDKLNDQASVDIPSHSAAHGQLDASNPHSVTSSSSSNAVGHGLEEVNWQKVERKPDPPALPELISLHDIPSSSDTAEAFTGETLDAMGIADLVQASTIESSGVCKSEGGLPSIAEEVVALPGHTSDAQGTGDVGQTSITESGEACRSESDLAPRTGLRLKTGKLSKDPGPPMLNLIDVPDAYRLAVGNKGSQASGMLTEHLTVKDSAKVNEDLKLLLSQIPPARGLELSLSDMSPRLRGFELSMSDMSPKVRGIGLSMSDMSPKVRGLGEELKISDVCSSIGSHTPRNRSSIERNESGLDSFDGSIVSEIEGESVIDRLKRQVEYDRKSMSALYKELEEERNASAIAANQAMAMITRLQEEKASLHMEALQYLRMMEEQAEYDVEALQKANDLLAEKEKELQDLEAELDIYRNLQEEKVVEKIQESYQFEVSDMGVEHLDSPCTGNSTNGGPCTLQSVAKSEDINKPENADVVRKDSHVNIINDSDSLGFEDERLYISKYLKKLEKMFKPCIENGVPVEMANGGYSGKKAHGLNDVGHLHSEETIPENSQMEEDAHSVQNGASLSREDLIGQETDTTLAGDSQFVCKECNHFDGPNSSITSRTTDVVSFGNEVLDLNERLEALEEDRNFLMHTINSLRNGDDGLKFIQEIAFHLRELRNIGICRREKDVA